MPRLKIHHKTEYRYARPVAFGEHRIMLRPHDGHGLRVLSNELEISPQPASLRWIHDVFGNAVAIAPMAMSAAATPSPGCRSICRAPAGSNLIPPTALLAPATSSV